MNVSDYHNDGSSLYLCANMFFQSHVLLFKVGTFEFCRFEVCAAKLILFI